MITTATGAETVLYVEAVRARLGGLRPSRREELLEDLRQHLAEVAAEAEAGSPLADLLGSPTDFADEYVSSAGIELPPSRPSLPGLPAALGWGVARAARSTREFLPELRPAWWAARGYLGVAAYAAVFDRTALLFPDVGLPGGRLTGAVLAFAAAAGSVALGRRAVAGMHRGWDAIASVAGVLAFLMVTIWASNPTRYVEAAPSFDRLTVGVTSDGRPVTNLWVYDSQGNLLNGVYVFDQEGTPLDTPATFKDGLATFIPVDASGELVVNQYPQVEKVVACGRNGEQFYAPVGAPEVRFPFFPGVIDNTRQFPSPTTAPAAVDPASPAVPSLPAPSEGPSTPTTVIRYSSGCP